MSVPAAVAFIGILVGTLQARFSSPSATWTVTSVVPSAARASLGFPPAIRAIAATAASVTPTRKLLRCRCPPPFRGSVHSILLFSGMDNFKHKAHKLKSHENPKYPHSSRSSPRPSTRRTGRFLLRRSIRLDGKQAAAIDISVRWVIGSMVSCRAWSGNTRLVPFAFSGHFILFPDIFAPFANIVLRCPQLPDCPRRSVLLTAIPCRYPVPCV